MAKFGKWIGGGLGWAIGGPIGAIFGFAIGSMVDGSGNVHSFTFTLQPSRKVNNRGVCFKFVGAGCSNDESRWKGT